MDFAEIDAIANADKWKPRSGWHDDHRHVDRTPEYRPAMMQVRSEFEAFVNLLIGRGMVTGAGRCLQLGIGEIDCSHEIWLHLFPQRTIGIDWRACRDGALSLRGADTRSTEARALAQDGAPYDLLFVDAGHKAVDCGMDHAEYGGLVRPGGIIGFHDALKRPGYEEEVEVWRYLNTLPGVTYIGTEVGIAWLVKT